MLGSIWCRPRLAALGTSSNSTAHFKTAAEATITVRRPIMRPGGRGLIVFCAAAARSGLDLDASDRELVLPSGRPAAFRLFVTWGRIDPRRIAGTSCCAIVSQRMVEAQMRTIICRRPCRHARGVGNSRRRNRLNDSIWNDGSSGAPASLSRLALAMGQRNSTLLYAVHHQAGLGYRRAGRLRRVRNSLREGPTAETPHWVSARQTLVNAATRLPAWEEAEIARERTMRTIIAAAALAVMS